MTLRAEYEKLATKREPYLTRGYETSELTLPSLLPRTGHSASSTLVDPHQSVGARGVNNLAARLLLALFPANQPFFRFGYAPDIKASIEELPDEDKAALEAEISLLETKTQSSIENAAVRPKLFEALKHLIVIGNVLVEYLPSGKLKVYSLSRYVCQRDYEDALVKVIFVESVAPVTLPDAVREALPEGKKKAESVDVYTGIELQPDGKYRRWQELEGEEVVDSSATIKAEDLPFLALRWTTIDGEDYGRGLAEENIGDLRSCEKLTKAIEDGASAAARILYMIDPNSTLRSQDLANKPNGGFVVGSRQDVTTLQLDKYADFRFVQETLAVIESRLEHAFLLSSSIQRNAERVTAEEIRIMAKELEDTLGGVYSLQSDQLQKPLVVLAVSRQRRLGQFPKLPTGALEPTILAGLEGLGRSTDVERIRSFISDAISLVGQEEAATYINTAAVLSQLQAGHGVAGYQIVRSAAEVQETQQQKQMQAMAQQAAGPMAGALANQQPPTEQEI